MGGCRGSASGKMQMQGNTDGCSQFRRDGPSRLNIGCCRCRLQWNLFCLPMLLFVYHLKDPARKDHADHKDGQDQEDTEEPDKKGA